MGWNSPFLKTDKGYIMLKFSALSLAQKKCVVALIEHTPALKKTGQITLKEVTSITQDLAAMRDQGAMKIGYPNWLFKANKIEKGVYQLPVPTAAELSAYQQEMDAKLNPVKKAKAKVAKLAQAKVIKTKAVKPAKKVAAKATEDESDISGSRLNRIIEESVEYDQDVEDFNAILRENGIEV
jgi:hypothetical protein